MHLVRRQVENIPEILILPAESLYYNSTKITKPWVDFFHCLRFRFRTLYELVEPQDKNKIRLHAHMQF